MVLFFALDGGVMLWVQVDWLCRLGAGQAQDLPVQSLCICYGAVGEGDYVFVF